MYKILKTQVAYLKDQNPKIGLFNPKIGFFRKASGKRVGKSEKPPIIPYDGAPVFVPTKELDELYNRAIEMLGLTLVQIAAPPIGPPIVIPIGQREFSPGLRKWCH